MKKQDNTFMDSPLNYNFTIINAICDFFPYLIAKIPSRVKRTEKIHLVLHHYCLFISYLHIQVSPCNFTIAETPHIFCIPTVNNSIISFMSSDLIQNTP